MKKLGKGAAAAAVILFAAGMIVYSKEVSAAVTESIRRCLTIIVPSLFAFMALSRLMISSGILKLLSVPFDMTIGRLLGMPKGVSALFIISNTAGYPVGASMLAEAVRSGRTERRSAEAALIYCYAGGPGYLINAIGVGIFGNKAAGCSLFLSVLTANAVLAAIVNRVYKPKIDLSSPDKTDISQCLTSSVTGAGESVIGICMMIVFFSAVLAVVEAAGAIRAIYGALGLDKNQCILLRSMLEITASADLGTGAVGCLPFLAAISSFGGLCVVLQLKTVTGGSIGLKRFLLWMPARICMVFGFDKLYNWLFVENCLPAFTKSNELIVELDNFLPSICLIMMIFLLVLQKRLDFLKRV